MGTSQLLWCIFAVCASGFQIGQRVRLGSSVSFPKHIQPKLHSTCQEIATRNEIESDLSEQHDDLLWKLLCEETGVLPTGLLRLDESTSGIRGVYLNEAVHANDIVLSIPIDKCLRDDAPPYWMPVQDEDDVDPYFGSDMAWATRLAACLLEKKHAVDLEKYEEIWISLLPDSSLLRASLPIHWEEEVVQSTRCTGLEVSVDSAFFARAGAVQDIEMALPAKHKESIDRRSIDDALDVVQTRTCRVTSEDGEAIRLLAPAFDFLNHDSDANCGFQLENNHLVVRSLVDIPADQEVFINYGEASTRPPWRALTNYGFVPCPQGTTDSEPIAEVYMNGVRYEVGPSFVPEDLVGAALESSILDVDGQEGYIPSGQEVELTPEIAERLAHRLAEVAFYLLVDRAGDPKADALSLVEEDDDEEEDTAEMILSAQLAASLRWNQHRILLSCSQGLQDWALQQST